jgi:hypothetical protein
LVVCAIFLFSLFVLSFLSLLFSPLIIDCRHAPNRLRYPNVLLCFTIARQKKPLVSLLRSIPDQRCAACSRTAHSLEVPSGSLHKDTSLPHTSTRSILQTTNNVSSPIRHFLFKTEDFNFITWVYFPLLQVHDQTHKG